MWSYQSDKIAKPRGLRYAVLWNAAPVSFAEVLRLWQDDAAFRSWFLRLLADVSFRAFRWETPPLTAARAPRAFEFVVLDDPGLDREPDADAFAEHFDETAPGGVVVFPNLGNNAVLVVPCPLSPREGYGHLAAFARRAPEPQQHALWQAVGAAMERRLGAKPVWLSTAGAGVAWLHVRLDDRPKYYGYDPYRDEA